MGSPPVRPPGGFLVMDKGSLYRTGRAYLAERHLLPPSRPMPSMRMKGCFLILAAACLLPGCGDVDILVPPDGEVGQFLQAEPLPEIRSYQPVFAVGAEELNLFRVEYGEPQDCPSGCFFLSAWGMQYGERIGWLDVPLDEGAPDTEGLQFFPLSSDDETLFRPSLLTQIENADPYLGSVYRLFLAGHPASPEDGLAAIAASIAPHGWLALGWKLLENPTVRQSREVLSILADLPNRRGYGELRARAAELLAELPGT